MTAKTVKAAREEAPDEKVYFARLTIENVRCFRTRQTLDLTARDGTIARWTLLIGENGTGKTTLLQAMAVLAPTMHDKADREYFLRGGRWGAIASAPISNQSRSIELKVRVGRDGHDPSDLALTAKTINKAAGGWTSSMALLEGRPVTPCIAYGAYRRAGREMLTGSESADALASLTESPPLVNAEEWFLRRDYAASNERNTDPERAAAAKSRDRVAAIVCRVLPDVEELVPVTRDAARGDTVLMAKTAAGMVRVAELGLGYQSTLAWVVDLALRLMEAYPESADPLAGPAVVLVDEIDLHLHPRWQRILLEELSATFPRVQFIATAHSPLIVQAAPDANVVVLRRVGDDVVIDRAPDSVRNWRVDQILTSDLFGLPSARPAQLDAKFRRREALLKKTKLTRGEREELDALREELGALPEGESPALLEAEEILLDLTRERIAMEKPIKKRAPTRRKGA